MILDKLDGVGPIKNRPSIDELNHFLWKNAQKTHVTHGMWHVTRDMWHVTGDMWHVVWGEHSIKMSAPYLLWFVIYDILKILRKRMNELMNEWMNKTATKLFVKHPLLNGVY